MVHVNPPKDGALTYAERIRSVVAEYEFRHGIVTVSLGAASLPEDGACGDDLVVAADKALYDAKRLGRNRGAAPRYATEPSLHLTHARLPRARPFRRPKPYHGAAVRS